MSGSNTRRRLSLLTGGSMLAAVVMAGAAGVALTPTAAWAANECTPVAPTLADPGGNGAVADTYLCAATYPSITYATNGAFTLQLQNNVTTTTGGVTINGTTNNAVTITRLSDSPANSGDPSLTSTSGAALSVTSAAGGAINVNLSDALFGDADTPMTLSGTSAGVKLQNAGTAATTFASTSGTITASAGAGIDVTTLSVGAGDITISTGSVVTGSTYGIRAGTNGSGNISISNTAAFDRTATGRVSGALGAILVTGGGNVTINNAINNTEIATLTGAVNLNNSGTVNFTNNGTWNASGSSTLGVGNTTLGTGIFSSISTTGATDIDFGAGTDSFANDGLLAIGVGDEAAATLTFFSVETWSNSNLVLFGSNGARTDSDGVANDRLVSSGTLFTGTGSSTFFMDVDFSADQASCAAAVTADCLDLRGSSTAGSTRLVVSASQDSMPAAERIVLIDVAGAGTSSGAHFNLDPASSHFRQIGAMATMEEGMFIYTLNYDALAQQHVLEAVAFGGRGLEVARIVYAASEPWRTATETWQERQTDLRGAIDGSGAGVAPGVWLKAAGTRTNETRFDYLDVGGEQVGYNLTSSQRTTAILGGVDVMGAFGDDGAWVVGLTAGKLNSTLDHRIATSNLELDGSSVGAYATVIVGDAYVDGIINRTSLDVTHTDLGQDFETTADSVGFQVEGGYRLFRINDDAAYIEPIATLSYVKTQVDDLTVGPVTGDFEDTTSLRGAIGVRIAGDLALDIVTARLAFTGRLWKEFDGEGETVLSAGLGQSTILGKAANGLGDVGVAVSLFAPGGPLSASLGYSLKFGEGYESSNAGLSVRLNW